jgi:hypothetical protein
VLEEKKTYLKKESAKFKRNIHQELALITHALRSTINSGFKKDNILAKKYT